MKRRLTSLLLVFAMVLTLLPIQALAVDTANPFRDVPRSSWYYDPVRYVCANGLFNGTSADTFSPGDYMTRGMFVTVLGRMAGVEAEKYAGPPAFTDVPEDAYFAPYVAWASRYGITAGTGDGKFSPHAHINRQQMAVFFVRYFEAFDVDYDTGVNITTAPADIDSVSDYARDAVLKLWRQGLLNGDGRRFDPFSGATRAQASMICYRTDDAVDTWYSEPGVPSARVRIDPDTGLPYAESGEPNTSTKPSGGSGGGGGGGSAIPSDSWAVDFYDGSRLIKRFLVKKGEALGQLPTVAESSKAGYILEGYYTDAGFTTPFYAEEPVTGSVRVYAKYESMGDPEALTLDSFARMDQQPDVSFRFKPLEGTADTLEAATAAVTLAVKDGTDPVEITVSGSGVYTVSAPAGFNEGCSYELDLAEGWTFLPDGSETIPSEAIRTAAFSIEMDEVENLSMNEGIRYVKDTETINYTYKDKDNKSYTVEELPSNADISKGGSFNYSDTTGWKNGDILCIYVGGKPDSDENERTEEAVYAKVSGISNGTVSFEPLAEEDRAELYNIPDNFPIKVTKLPTGDAGTVSISGLDTPTYALMVGAGEGTAANAKAKLGEGDFVTLYVSADNIASESDVYFGRVTGVNGETITYERCTAQDIEESADLYTKVSMTGEELVTAEEEAAIEQTVLAQVQASGFGEDAAWALLDLASQTDGFKNTAGLRDVLIRDGEGYELSAESVQYLARNVGGKFELGDDVKLKVELIRSGDQLHFKDQGLQLAIGVSAEFEVDAKDGGKVHIDLSATFVQEVAVDPAIRGELVYKKILKFIPVPIGVQINAAVDVKSFTAVSLKAEIFTEAAEEEGLWEKFKKFAKDPSELGDLPGLPEGLADGLKTVGDAIDRIEEVKGKIDQGLEDAKKLQSDLDALWGVVENVSKNGLDRETYEQTCQALGKTNITGELMEMLHLTADTDLSVEYIEGLSALMDRYSELLEKETDWVTLVEQEMFNQHTPEKFGVMIGIQGKFMVRADLNLAIGSNLQYEVGKRYNFWFRIGLFTPSSGSSCMDLIDESFAFQFYVMGKIGLKAGVRLKIYAAIGSVDAVSVGLTTELGPYLKLWGFFIYDYSKYRPANAPTWTSREQMAGALYLEFGLYLMVGVEAKALFLEYDKDFIDKEFPLLKAGDREYRYDMACEPLDESDEIVVYNDGTVPLQPGCRVSMALPEEAYALKCIDLTTGKQSTRSLGFDDYTFKVSNPNFRVDNVDGKPVISVVTVPPNVRLMQCDLTITYKHGKLAFSTYDMTTTVHLAWTNMTAAEYQQVYTASVTIPDGNGGREAIWSQRVRKGTPFDLPTDEEIKALLSWSDAKYVAGDGYGSQPTEDVTLIQNTQYPYDLGYQTYALTVTGIEGVGSQVFEGQYGEPFDFSSLTNTGKGGPEEYTRFAGLMMKDDQRNDVVLPLNQPINGKFAASNHASAAAQYEDETVAATFQFDGIAQEDITVKLRKGDVPATEAVVEAVREPAAITGFYPAVGPIESSTVYQVVCEVPAGSKAIVTFDAKGGSAVESRSLDIGSVLGALPAPTRTGYTFGGWFTDDGTFQNQVDINTIVNSSMTLYAKWTAVQVTVTFNANGGTLTGDSTRTVAYGEAYGALPTPEKSEGTDRHYAFLGWYTAADDSGTKITAEDTVDTTANLTLYAHWRLLKTIPDTVFTFTKQELTYNGAYNRAVYTFKAEEGESYTQDSFKVEYVRVADEFITANTAYDEPQYNAGTYNIHITRPADDTYDLFDYNYDGVLEVKQAQPTFTWITAEDITVSEPGLTRATVTVDPVKMAKTNLVLSSHLYYRLSNTGSTGSYSHKYTYMADRDGVIRDLPETLYIYQVGTPETINYKAAWSSEFGTSIQLNKTMPTDSWANYADTNWYDDSQDTFEIDTAAELAGLIQLTKGSSSGPSFAGKTVTLTADIDLSDHIWAPGGRFTESTSSDNWYTGFCGTFNGNGHTISGMYAGKGHFACEGETYIDFTGLFGVLGKGRYTFSSSNQDISFTKVEAHQIVIENLTLEDSLAVELDGRGAKAGLTGFCMIGDTGDTGITFRNCSMGIIDLSNDTRLTNWYGWAYRGRDPVVEDCEILRPDVTIVKEWITIDTNVK